ncbi:MAG: DUF192 domain-containing protein [Collinsella sp.]|jgi:uncharacterized membrane protein (UPF0127 family)|nr:DUF192 domain-containing protein [Collinsella sp.]
MSFEYDIPCVATTRSGAKVPISLRAAKTFRDKAIGYMGARSIAKSCGTVYARGRSIHTLFMRIPVDVCWIGRFDPSSQSWPVVSLDASVPPWRVLFAPRGAVGGIEVAPGTFTESDRPLSIRRLD